MLYTAPALTAELREQLGELDELRESLGRQVGAAGPWLGTLRRLVQASSIESSTSIEGFNVSPEEAVAIVSGLESASVDDENRMASRLLCAGDGARRGDGR